MSECNHAVSHHDAMAALRGRISTYRVAESDCPHCLRAKLADAAAEVDRLLAIVAKLPELGDGAPAIWGIFVWSAQGTRWKVHDIWREGLIQVDNEKGSRFWRTAHTYYSTLAAATAAGGET